jgi:hypothetical protein
VATGPLALPLHARSGGLEYESPFCELPVGYDVTCEPGTTKVFDGAYNVVTGDPFVVMATAVCAPVGLGEDRANRLVVDRLKAGEQAAVEDIFSRGTFGQAPSLANNASATTLTAAANVVNALGALESWLYARYGPAGTLHIPAVAAAEVMAVTGVRYDTASGIWLTAMGTKVSFGNYSGLTAAGAAPAAGHTTFYITGQVTIWRDSDSDIFVAPYGQVLNRSTNQAYMLAERNYVLAFDCFVAAIDVDLAP